MQRRVLNRFLCQIPVRVIARERISARQQAGSESVGVVNLLVLCCYSGRDVADTKSLSVRKRLEIAQNVLAGADGDSQVAVFFEMVIGIQKGVTDERRPYYRRRAPGQIKTSRLVIKMVAPARSRIARRLVLHQPSQCHPGFVSPSSLASGLMKTDKASGQKPHALAGRALGDSQYRTQVQRKPAYSLLEHRSKELVLEGEPTQQFCVQTVHTITAVAVTLVQPIVHLSHGFVDLSLQVIHTGPTNKLLTNRCRRTYHSHSGDRSFEVSPRAPDPPQPTR